jgi:N-methylhydantoinase A
MMLDRAAAQEAIHRRVAAPLGMDHIDAARAIVRVANANMADAVRLISIRRGLDPREFALVAFGGAGPLHGAAVAKELSIPAVVIVPPNPGITSALGCLLVDVRHDLSTMYLRATDDAELGEIEREFARLEEAARERLRHEHVPDEPVTLQRTIAMRYLGQWRSLAVPVASGLRSLDEAVTKFHAQHEREYTYRRDDAAVEIYQLGVRAIGITPKPELRRYAVDGTGSPEPSAHRLVTFDELEAPAETPVFERAALPAGTVIHGPAVIDQFDSTTLVPRRSSRPSMNS